MPYKLYKIIFPLAVSAIIIFIAAFWLTYKTPRNLEIDFLDVGQGDAELIKTPYGQNILMDGGPSSVVIKRLSENLPWWDRTIDLVMLSHPHDDHVSGLNDVLKRYKVKKIVMTGVNHTGPSYIEFLKNVQAENIPVVLIDRPQVIQLGRDCRLNIIWPEENLAGKEVKNLNDTSIVFRLEYGETGFLLTGDIETKAEKMILSKPELLRADVLKVSHHGSNLSTGEEFLRLVKPEIAVIEVGQDNKFGHPSPIAIKRLEKAGVKIFRTDLDGTIRIFSDGKNIWTRL